MIDEGALQSLMNALEQDPSSALRHLKDDSAVQDLDTQSVLERIDNRTKSALERINDRMIRVKARMDSAVAKIEKRLGKRSA